MASLNFLYARLVGWTATFKMPHFYSNSGTKSVIPTLKLPPYTTIIGMLGNIVGRDLEPDEIKRVGYCFEYQYESENVDFERVRKFEIKNGVLRESLDTPNPARREFIVRPNLHLYLENLELFEPYFFEPFNIPCFGRSQDLAWFETLPNGKQYEIIVAEEVKEGMIEKTLLPFPQVGATGIIMPLADYYDNFTDGQTRSAGSMRTYQFVEKPAKITRKSLFKVSNGQDRVIYMHDVKS